MAAWRKEEVDAARHALSEYLESMSYVLSFRMVFFYLVTTGWIFDISLRENRINQSINRQEKREATSRTPIGLVDEPEESCTGARRTETCVARCNSGHLFALSYTPRVLFSILFYFLRTSSVGGGYAARLFLLFSFPCSADHERIGHRVK